MTPIKKMIKELREAADALENLFITDNENESFKVAKKILKTKSGWNDKQRKAHSLRMKAMWARKKS